MRKIAMEVNDDEPDELGEDEYIGQRLHAWVMVKKGKRGVQTTVFIEPSTGRIFSIDNCQYISVDCVFNHENFWINLKPTFPIVDLHFDDMTVKPIPSQNAQNG